MTKTKNAVHPFTASQFTPTKHSTAADKAKFANHFVRFLEAGCPDTQFPDWFYKRLSMCFGHIAHYNNVGFFDTWFRSPLDRFRFVEHTLRASTPGDPAWTYCDVEQALKGWLGGNADLQHRYRSEVESTTRTKELAILEQLVAKYPDEAATQLDKLLAAK